MPLFDSLSSSLEHSIVNVRVLMLLLILRNSKPGRRIHMMAICALLRCSKAALSRMFDTVCERGYVSRTRDESDQRYIMAVLTPKGRALLRALGAA
jgi:DNA-binding MarR family transcriptional regulator